jgi:hypothetical protein
VGVAVAEGFVADGVEAAGADPLSRGALPLSLGFVDWEPEGWFWPSAAERAAKVTPIDKLAANPQVRRVSAAIDNSLQSLLRYPSWGVV